MRRKWVNRCLSIDFFLVVETASLSSVAQPTANIIPTRYSSKRSETGWTGLLIEANPDYHRALLDKNRHAYVLRTCLSTERRPTTVRMQPAGALGGIADKMHKSHLTFIGANIKPEIAVNCFPLNTITAELGVSHVDYLSLDVEGPEIEILRTVDWTRLHIDVITVEYRIYGGDKIGIDQPTTLKKLSDLRQFFLDTGIYREVALLPNGSDAGGLDVVFSRLCHNGSINRCSTGANDVALATTHRTVVSMLDISLYMSTVI